MATTRLGLPGVPWRPYAAFVAKGAANIPVSGPYHVAAAEIFHTGAATAEPFNAGSATAEVFHTGAATRQIHG